MIAVPAGGRARGRWSGSASVRSAETFLIGSRIATATLGMSRPSAQQVDADSTSNSPSRRSRMNSTRSTVSMSNAGSAPMPCSAVVGEIFAILFVSVVTSTRSPTRCAFALRTSGHRPASSPGAPRQRIDQPVGAPPARPPVCMLRLILGRGADTNTVCGISASNSRT